jgi:hypothetical protein
MGHTGDAPPTPGGDTPFNSSEPIMTAGGGGGGLGRVRINTPDGSYAKSATTIEAAVVTSGVVSRR